MASKIKHYCETGKVVTIRREEVDPHALYGFVLGYTDDLLLIAREYDFFLDGWMVLNRRAISELQSTKSNAYCKKILKQEGLLGDLSPGFDVDLSSYQGLFQSLRRQRIFVIVESESLDEDDETFLIGPIGRITQRRVVVRYFDGCGKWTDDTRTIDYSNITAVQFGGNYIRLHQKYIDAL